MSDGTEQHRQDTVVHLFIMLRNTHCIALLSTDEDFIINHVKIDSQPCYLIHSSQMRAEAV